METDQKKLTECYYLVKNINETFGIKIDTNTKNTSIVWFRHYITNKYKNDALRVTYEPLGKHHGTISAARKLLHKLTAKKEFIDISEVIESMDTKLYRKFIETHVTKKKRERKIVLSHEVNIKKLQMPTGEAMLLLRRNPKSNLWNKKISDWSYNDWQELKTY